MRIILEPLGGQSLRLPPLKIYSGGKLNEDLLAIILNNSRTPHLIKGDVQAHLGALLAAEQEMQRACDRYGVDTVRAAMKKIQAYTEKMVRESIRTIPNGTYEAEDYADTDGISQNRVKVRVKLEILDDAIKVDFTGTDPMCQGAINSPKTNTVSAALYSLQFFLAPDAPQNQGLFNPIEVVLPEGCWLNATWPAPTIGCTTLTASKITSAIWQALAKAIPERVTGSTCADANWFVASCVDAQGRADVFSDLPAGGWGGTPYSDGMNVTMDPLGNCMNMTMGPLIDAGAVRKIQSHIDDAVAKGARILAGGRPHDLGGTFFQPTILTEVPPDALVAREETFGPLAPLLRFSDEAEAIGHANDTEFGLAAYFYTRDLGRIFRVAEALEYGMVGVNSGAISNEVAPFGGVKASGLGREGSKYGLGEYMEIKYLNLAL